MMLGQRDDCGGSPSMDNIKIYRKISAPLPGQS
jgi:hypothetical protein